MLSGFLGIVAAALLWPAEDAGLPPARPVLVELYTSQGCPLCPAANAYLGELDARADVFTLGFSVDYWDVYGWRDTLARPEFSERQRAYKGRFGLTRVYTPQMVIDGAAEAAAGDAAGVVAAIAARGPAVSSGVQAVSRTSGGGNHRVYISGAPPQEATADVWLAVYRPGWVSVAVSAGPNAGTEMRLYNPVRALIHLGEWTGGAMDYGAALPPGSNGAVIVQERGAGPVYAVAVFAEAPER